MAYLIEPTPAWVDVFQIETTTLVLGGVGGPANAQAVALMQRTGYLLNRANTTDVNVAANAAAITTLNTYAGQLGGKNLLLNAEGRVNQRAFAGGSLAAGTYGYDRWRGGTGGCNITMANGLFTHVSGPLQQVIESADAAWGVALTVSVENPSQNLSISLGGATGTITAGAGRRSVTLTPSGSGDMTFQITPAASATYSRPQIERGTVATSFDWRPLAAEVDRCRRYFRLTRADARFPATGVGQTVSTPIVWDEMRTTPTFTISSAGSSNLTAVGTPPTLNGMTPRGGRFDLVSSGAGDCYCIDRVYALNAEL